jgi:hypothetical protein
MQSVEKSTGWPPRKSIFVLALSTPTGPLDLARINESAMPSDSRILSAYRVHGCGVSRIRLASHHLSVTWLGGFEAVAQSYLAVAASKSTIIGSMA